MNNFNGIGRLVVDPEYSVHGGVEICRLRIAISRKHKDKTTGKYESDFFNCVAFGKLANLIKQHFSKGDRIGIVGRLQSGSYEKNGEKRYTVDIVIDTIDFIEKKAAKADDPFSGFERVDEDIPF